MYALYDIKQELTFKDTFSKNHVDCFEHLVALPKNVTSLCLTCCRVVKFSVS